MSSPSQPSGTASTLAGCASASLAKVLAATTSVGSSTGYESGLCSRICSAILPPISTRSARPPRCLEHCELVVDLGPAGDQHERPLDVVAEEPAEVVELGEQQQPRIGRKQMGDRLGRAVRAVGRAEGVVHVEVVAIGELAREALVVLRLAGVEARVLEHLQPLVGHELAQPPLDRRDRERRPVFVGLRPARGASRPSRRRRRGRAEAAVSGSRPGSACRRRPCRPRAARSGRRARAHACPRRRPSRRSAGASSQSELAHQVDEPAAVAPLVVVPAEDLDVRPCTIVSSAS